MLGCTATENVMYGIMLNPKKWWSQQIFSAITYLQESDEWQVSAKFWDIYMKIYICKS